MQYIERRRLIPFIPGHTIQISQDNGIVYAPPINVIIQDTCYETIRYFIMLHNTLNMSQCFDKSNEFTLAAYT